MNNKSNLVVFGELLIRLNTKNYERFCQADEFEIFYTGAEVNAAVSCSNYGMDSFVVSKIPIHEIGDSCIKFLKKFGLHTRYIVRGGTRLGLLYVENGISLRPSKVIYDRTGSSFCGIKTDDFDWDFILKDKKWFHFSGTTPALGNRVKEELLRALQIAQKYGLCISVDYNYREKLWSRNEARMTMKELMPYIDIGIGNEEDCESMFGIKAKGSNIKLGKIDIGGYESVAKQMIEEYGLKLQAITLRESKSASKNGWSAILHDGNQCYCSKKYEIDIVDRMGGGDAFTGGLIYSLSYGKSLQESLDFAVAASSLKHTIPGDFNLVTQQEVEILLRGDTSGRIQR